MTVLNTANLAAQIATVASVLVAVWAILSSAKDSHKQSQLNTFITYAQRYEQIMNEFPEYKSRFDLNILPPDTEQVRLAALKYFNLTSEEFYLCKKKYIDSTVWEIWEAEIIRTLKSPLMIREWGKLKEEFKSYPEFSRFIERVQSEASRLSL